MLITREIDYTLRILRALAGGEQLTVRDLNQREQLPQQFAYKILRKLQRAGWVQVARGADGGFRLRADLAAVNLYDLMVLMEADLRVNACMDEDYDCSWQRQHGGPCRAHYQLEALQDGLNGLLRAQSLQRVLFGEKA